VSQPTTVAALTSSLAALVTPVAATCPRPDTAAVFQTLTQGLQLNLGRHTISQLLLSLGQGEHDHSAAYRLFSQGRFDLDAGRRALLAGVLAGHDPEAPLPVVVDATHLPRTSRTLVGVGLSRCPRTPVWARGIHWAQRWEGLSALLPCSAQGDSRAVPLSFAPAPTPKATPWPDHPPCTEGEAALTALTQLRTDLAALEQPARPVLALADGQYSGAPFLRALPADVVVLARCAKNRALYALPDGTPTGGRPRLYGARAPRPDHDLTGKTGWRRCSLTIRDRTIPVRYRRRGPYRVKGAPDRPVFLLVVGGVRNHPKYKRRDPTFWLVTATQDEGGAWRLPDAVATLLGWAWQRWEVEVLHRELKSGFGLGEQQATTPMAACTTIQWVVWAYACLVLAAYQTWGWGPGPPGPKWWRGRRWTGRSVIRALRTAGWGDGAGGFWPGWPAMPGSCPERAPPLPPLVAFATQASRL
jgi:hypothetical protein